MTSAKREGRETAKRRWSVGLTREQLCAASVVVEASTREEARAIAQAMLDEESGLNPLPWEPIGKRASVDKEAVDIDALAGKMRKLVGSYRD